MDRLVKHYWLFERKYISHTEHSNKVKCSAINLIVVNSYFLIQVMQLFVLLNEKLQKTIYQAIGATTVNVSVYSLVTHVKHVDHVLFELSTISNEQSFAMYNITSNKCSNSHSFSYYAYNAQ